LTEAQLELADSMVLHRDPAAIVINKPPALPRRAAAA
jgi:23S rRNA pseudouridine955/2504/2580 synthase